MIGVPNIPFPLYPEIRVGPPTPGTYSALKAFRPDIAHFIHPILIGIPGMLMARRIGIPSVASFHLDVARIAQHYRMGFVAPFTDLMTRIVFNAADASLAPSRRILDDMQRIGVNDVRLWKRGVDAGKFNPRHRSEAMREQLSGGNPGDTLLLYVGRVSAEKQVDQLRAVLERVPGTRLAIVGDGPARAQFERHFAGTPAHFIGYLKGQALSEAYASADIFVFPSALETFGLVVVEAMAAGLPVVSSRVGGVRDIVQEGVTGYTFDVNDIEGMVDGVARIASSRARIAEMGRAARAFAETQTWDAMMDEVIALYDELIAARGGASLTA